MDYSIEVLAKEIAERAELEFSDVLEDLYLKLYRYHVPMYRDVMISLYFLKKRCITGNTLFWFTQYGNSWVYQTLCSKRFSYIVYRRL